MNRKYDTDLFIKRAKKVHGDKYDYSSSHFLTIEKKVLINCPIHGSFWQRASAHLGGHGCSPCGRARASDKKLRKKAFSFIERARAIYGNKYDYSLALYRKASEHVTIICPSHGKFFQSPNSHLSGRGCRSCGIERRAVGRRRSWEEFCSLANEIHGQKYTYIKKNLRGNNSKIGIECPVHGLFEQKIADHLSGKGCYQCGLKKRALSHRKTTKQFIKQASKIHGDKYDYSYVKYVHGREKVNIRCKEHGSFWQTPEGHLSGRGCRKCSSFISKKETSWLDSLSLPRGLRYRNVTIETGHRVDGFDAKTNTVYEFYGDFWHGNPKKFSPNEMNDVVGKKFGQLYRETIARENKIRDFGYRVITIWESDWD